MTDSTERGGSRPLPEDRRRRILITLLHPGYARNYEGVLRLLLQRGHRVHLLMLLPSKQASDRVAERLGEQFSNLTISSGQKAEADGWRNLRWSVRLMIDYARYLHPRYRTSDALRDRVAEKLLGTRSSVGWVTALIETFFVRVMGRFRGARYSDFLVRSLLRVEAALPGSKRVETLLRSHRPDVLITSPYVAVGSREPDYLSTAQQIGIRTGVLVASWDNLTNKGLIKLVPDRVFVWNETQRTEAIEMHSIPSDRVIATGAPRFDDWFARAAFWTRPQFVEMVGLNPDAPIILYLCSSPFIAPDEISFVRRFVEAVRDSDGVVRGAGILIRPHPQNAKQWLETSVDDLPNVVVWPPAGEQPVDTVSRAGFYDSIYHAAAVVGINTSAQIEAGIVGKTVHTVLDAQFAETQEGTLHFHHLLAENGGLLFVAKTLPDLVTNLERAVTGELDDQQTLRFIESFVRPHGLDVDATPLLADAIQDLCDLPAPAPKKLTLEQRVIRTILRPLAAVARPNWWALVRNKIRSRFRPKQRRPRTPAQTARTKAKHLLRPYQAIKEQPLILGPWLGDTSHELLYWVPFLRWVSQTNAIPAQQLIAVSRSGARDFYANFCDGYIDVFDLVDPALVQRSAMRATDRTGAPRDAALRRVITDAALDAAPAGALTLPPEILTGLFRGYWNDRLGLQPAARFLDLRTLRPLVDPELEARLPKEYVVCAFQFSECFPDTSQNRTLVNELIDRVRQHITVVVLGARPGERGAPVPVAPRPGVVRLIEDFDARQTLHVQTVAVSRASGVIASHGPVNHLAIALGVPNIGVISDEAGLNARDLDLALRLVAVTGGEMTLLPTEALSFIEAMFRPRRRSDPTKHQELTR